MDRVGGAAQGQDITWGQAKEFAQLKKKRRKIYQFGQSTVDRLRIK